MSDRGWDALDSLELDVLLERHKAGPEPEAPPESLLARLRRFVGSLLQAGAKPRPGVAPSRLPPADWRREPPEEDLFGLALSGGGIRSATFNLGLLQGLRRQGLLKHFHYLSTVSGGGYVGGFWSAWKARPGRGGTDVFPGDPALRSRPEPEEIRHLREFGNFLRPRLQLLSYETGRLVAALAGGVLPGLTLALSVMLLALLAWWAGSWLLSAEASGRALSPEGLLPGLLFATATFAVQGGFELIWRRRREEAGARATTWYWFWATVSATVSGALWWGLWSLALPPRLLLLPLPLTEVGTGLAAALLPLGAWATVVLVLVLLRSALSLRHGRDPEGRARQGALDRTLARIVFCAAVWGVAGGVWVVGQLLAGEGVAGLLAAAGVGGGGGGAFAWLRRLMTAQANKPTGGKVGARIRPWLLQLLAYLSLGAASAAVAALPVLLHNSYGAAGPGAAAIAAGFLVLLCLAFFDPHEVGFHAFYRSRLVRAYLGASNESAPPRATAECGGDDLPLGCLADRPLHLVCCAANDLAGDPLSSLHRGADSAVLSKLGLQIGDRWRPWAKDAERPTLGDAMTASAAAFNSHMGVLSMRLGQAATFLLTALGLRLGLWLENPSSGRPGGKRPRGHLFLRELFGLSSSRCSWIHLSDGAHFENLALYELVRRHCRFILLSDCGSDPDRAFDDFGNAVRRIREDFGVEIDIDVSPLRPGDDGRRSRQPMVAGDVRYPPRASGGAPDVGILLYVKPTLTGDEPADIVQYAGRNERFPHETTLDQFYDEAQWESYRRLGEHAVEEALRPIEGWKAAPARLFLRARYYWPPLPDDGAVADRLEAAWARLQDRLEERAFRALRRQVESRDAGRHPLAGRVRDEHLVACLPAVREAVRLMEAVYLRTGFGRDDRAPSHRRYMGWLNRFGIWASAPIFRAWWPWLAPLQAGDFTEYMERWFELPGLLREGRVRELTPDAPGGYARERWEGQREATAPQPPKLYGYFLELGPDQRELHAALVEVRPPPGSSETATWSHEDFFVAPGLWGIGVGERFLDGLLKELEGTGFETVEVTMADGASASEDALYSGAGFRRSNGGFRKDLRRS